MKLLVGLMGRICHGGKEIVRVWRLLWASVGEGGQGVSAGREPPVAFRGRELWTI